MALLTYTHEKLGNVFFHVAKVILLSNELFPEYHDRWTYFDRVHVFPCRAEAEVRPNFITNQIKYAA